MKKAEILLVLDRSGSMATVVNDAIGGLNTFLEAQKALPGKAKITILKFDNEIEYDYTSEDLQKVKAYDIRSYVPRGTTALYDAIAAGVELVSGKLKTSKAKTKPKVIVAILTDGYENASQNTTKDDVATLVKSHTDAGWEFIYLAANQDAWEVGQQMKFQKHNTANFAHTSAGTRSAYDSMNATVSMYRK